MAKIDFDKELAAGPASFNRELGRWWNSQAADYAHKRAYSNIARYLGASLRPPLRIVDYACGAGQLLSRLAIQFPEAHLAGIDGSSYLLGLASRRITRLGRKSAHHIELIEAPLPNFSLARGKADLVIFAFPNMAPSQREKRLWSAEIHLGRNDKMTAKALSRLLGPEDGPEPEDAATICLTLLRERLISLNLRLMLKRGGTCARIEYGSGHRHELTRTSSMRVAFAEGSLDIPVNGMQAKSWFRIAAASYFRSRVIEDVYQQTANPDDRKGGYLITILRAL